MARQAISLAHGRCGPEEAAREGGEALAECGTVCAQPPLPRPRRRLLLPRELAADDVAGALGRPAAHDAPAFVPALKFPRDGWGGREERTGVDAGPILDAVRRGPGGL